MAGSGTRPMSGRRIAFVALVTVQVIMAARAGSPAGIVLALLAIALALPWHFLFMTTSDGRKSASPEPVSLRKWLTGLAMISAAASFFVGVSAYSSSPEGMAAHAERERERRIERAMDAARERAREVAQQAEREKERAFGQHCASPLNGTYRPLVEAVESRLRNPDSFEHVETHGTRIDADGNHRIIMSFRAENGFGGLNLETATAIVRSSDCTMISWEFGG